MSFELPFEEKRKIFKLFFYFFHIGLHTICFTLNFFQKVKLNIQESLNLALTNYQCSIHKHLHSFSIYHMCV